MMCKLTIKKYIIFIPLLAIICFLSGCSPHPKGIIKEKYQYDSEGRLICRILPDGNRIKYKYNDQGFLIETKYPGDSVKYKYDANGMLISMQNKNGKTEYRYDSFDRLTEVIFKYGLEKKIKYEYDPWDRISSIKILGNGRLDYNIKYEYDLLGNLISIEDGIGRVEYEYYPERGEVVRRLPNGIKTISSYSPLGELVSLKHLDLQNRMIVSYRYEYESPGKISCVIETTPESVKVTRYEWDSRGYLKTLHLPDGFRINYTYDTMGNRLSMAFSNGAITYRYGNFGMLTQAGDIKYEWDKNGNLISLMEKGSKIRISDDRRNLPTSISTPEAIIHYGWDGDGNLILRRKGKDITYYLPNPLAPSGFTLAEFDKRGKLTASYLYGDILLGQRDMKGKMQYFLEDGFNSIRHIVDMNGRIIGQRDYTPFGEPINSKGDFTVNFRMQGERFLPEINSYIISGRLYEPRSGRYLTPDQFPGYMERFDSFNKYAHGCNAQGIFMEPRCNQTKKGYISTLPEAQAGPNLFRAYKNISVVWGIGRFLDWSAKEALGKSAGGVTGQLLIGGVLRPFSFWTGLEKRELERAKRGLPLGSSEFWKDWGKSGLAMLGSAIGAAVNPYVALGTALLFRTAAEGWDIFTYYAGIAVWRVWHKLIDVVRGPFGGGFTDPFKSIENQLGGIELSATGEFIGSLGNITGAVFDPEKECLVLLSDKDLSVPSLKPEDLAVALMSVFRSEPQDPQFSLDPADPKNPKGKWLKAVYIPEEIIAGTGFGKALFEADWLLKQYSFGVRIDENGKLQERKSCVNGFKSIAELSFERQNNGYGKEQWARFWIVSDEMKLKEAENSIYFDVAKMRVKARKQVVDPTSPTGLRDVDTEDDPIATEFANLFTKLYDEIAKKESPEFERVRQLAKVVALAKWLKKEGIPIDMNWVIEHVNKRIKTVDKITALSVQWENQQKRPYSKGNLMGVQTIIRQIYLFGGVDLTVNPEYTSDDGIAQNLQNAVKSKLREKSLPVFEIEHNGKSFLAMVLPITGKGKEMWKNCRSLEKNGFTYQVNEQGRVTRGIDKDGNVREYNYDSNGKLKGVKMTNSNGWKIIGERNENGSLWTVTNPRGNTFKYKYDSLGYLSNIEVDGRILATYEIDQRNKEAIIQFPDYTERILFDERGNIREYQIQAKGKPLSQRIAFSYNTDGNLTKIEGSGVPSLNIYYAENDIKPALIILPQLQIRYLYDSNGRIKEIETSNGISATYEYEEGDQLVKLKLNYQGRRAEYIFSQDGIVQSSDFLGGIASYGYSNGMISSVKLGSYGEAKYIYDDRNRIRKIHFPNGDWIEYRYYKRKGKGEIFSQDLIESMVTHSSSIAERSLREDETEKN